MNEKDKINDNNNNNNIETYEIDYTKEDTGKPEINNEIRIKIFGRTDVGLVREHNEDNFIIADLDKKLKNLLPEVREHIVGKKGSLFVVCDGMGGAAAGEVASQIAVDTLFELLVDSEPAKNEIELAKKLEKAACEAGERIYMSAKMDYSRHGMGTTLTAAALINSRLILAQVGDSRAYIIRNKEITQVTKDQSLVEQLIEAGQLKPEDASKFEHSNIILQALGTESKVSVDISYVDLQKGDRLIMCSDGLSGLVNDKEIEKILSENDDPLEACKILTEKAKEAGGHDNITVIVAHFDGPGLYEKNTDEKLSFQRLKIGSESELENNHDNNVIKRKPFVEEAEIEKFDINDKKIILSKIAPKQESNEAITKPEEESTKSSKLKKKSNKLYYIILLVIFLLISGYSTFIGYIWGKKQTEKRLNTNITELNEKLKSLEEEFDEKEYVVINPENPENLPIKMTIGDTVLTVNSGEKYIIKLKSLPQNILISTIDGQNNLNLSTVGLEKQQIFLLFPINGAESNNELDGGIEEIDVSKNAEIEPEEDEINRVKTKNLEFQPLPGKRTDKIINKNIINRETNNENNVNNVNKNNENNIVPDKTPDKTDTTQQQINPY